MDLFRVRLNCIDYYSSSATRYDPQLRNDVRPSQASKGPKVPVVRIFGSTETGQKVCAHVHGAFPYLYVEYQGSLAPEDVGAFIYRLHLSIDHALAVSYRRDQHGDGAKFVARITLIKGIPFYGFHVGYRPFLKIYMFNPVVMTRLADLLQQGVIMKHKFQPYEAHLQYLAQFMVDYNLYGCDYLDSSKTMFRSPVPDKNEESSLSHLWHSGSVQVENITDDLGLPRASHCSIEVDICVQHIVNRKLVKERLLHHDFIELKHPIPADLKLVHSMAGLWKDEGKRRQLQNPGHKPGSSPFAPDALVSMSNGRRDSQPQGWIHEDEYQDQIRKLIAKELEGIEGLDLGFDNFAHPIQHDQDINTALQSVQDLYPCNLIPVLGLSSSLAESVLDPASSIDVDEKKALQASRESDDFFPDDSDEDALHALLEARPNTEEKRQKPLDNPNFPVDENLDLKTTPTAKEDNDSPHQIFSGICQSGLQSGKIPQMPISQALLDAAEHYGLVGRSQTASTSISYSALKRRRSDLWSDVASKRSKPDSVSTITKIPSGTKRTESQALNPVIRNRSHESDTGLQHQALDVMMIKSQPQGSPSSHSSQYPASQLSGNTTFKKKVSFHANTFENNSISARMLIAPGGYLPPGPSSSEITPKTLRVASNRSLQRTLTFSVAPPPASDASITRDPNLPDVIYRDPYYSNESDVPMRSREYAGREFRIDSDTLPFLPDFDPTGTSPETFGIKLESVFDRDPFSRQLDQQSRECSSKFWQFSRPPPTYREVKERFNTRPVLSAKGHEEQRSSVDHPRYLSQIDGPTPKTKHGFKYTQTQKKTSVQHEVQYMSTMSLEVHVNTRGKFVPNPEEDQIQCIFWAVKSDESVSSSRDAADSIESGIIVLCGDGRLTRQIQRQTGCQVLDENSELDLIIRTIEIVRTYDPDVLTGYEVHGSSWGFLIERARVKYDYNLCDEFSRMKTDSHGRFGKQNDRWGFNTSSTIRVTGRHMINIWRAMRGELNLLQYTMENVVWHLLRQRIPHYSWKTLTGWYNSGKLADLSKLLRYYRRRTRLDIEILEANELIPRTSEQARLLGVDFFSVFSRGSQFKVESIMFRIAKPENFILISPSRKQVGSQNALECLPLVMEPQSAFYSSPVLVLDFQSLYPSVMIAYNYCYSTFLGRIASWRGTSKMGFTDYQRQENLLALLKDHINIAPNGMMYAKAEVRKSLLAKMLTEILETRVMVKSGMKQDKDDKTLQQLLNNRQLALKLLANVTYGYASASFSGRMPCSEIADSIVQTGRETLERAIAHIHSVERWGAEVVYGDTDSLFIHLKGKTKDQAFDIGNEISQAITKMNPRPIKLKFEKVYLPCVLLAKKRYVGYMYESKGQVKPDFDAKGIETVRRDGTPAEQKIEEKALRLLFETADLSQIKSYFQRQCDKIMRGAVSVQDFCFAKEVRLGSYSDKGVPPAGALISTKRMLEDARAEPQYGERVPYVVISGAPGARLIDRCVAPEDLLQNPHWQLDSEYYISKNLIPPLERIFNLMGANVRQWYDEMPKVQRIHQATGAGSKKATLESYMKSTHCLVCGMKFTHEGNPLCPACRANVPASALALQVKLSTEERKYQEVVSLCQSCSGFNPLDEVRCDSKDCPVFWTRVKQRMKVSGERTRVTPILRELADGLDTAALEW